MCGIAGYIGAGDPDGLSRMNEALRHRGPDAEGKTILSGAGLAQRRLAIIDLSPAGKQPMSNEDGTVWITFNGEIYNFKALRKSLKAPHDFRSDTDSEVIIHLYEEVGEKVFELIDGMFAIGLYDQNKKILYLARDRFGKKPLYISEQKGVTLFASEMKGILAYPGVRRSIDFNALNKYLQYEYVPSPHTIFEGIQKLEPGHVVSICDGVVRKKKFWDIRFDRFPRESWTFDAAKDALDASLSAAVGKRLMSDVPLGVFLSGGIDSSTVAYYAAQASTQKVQTFSIGFKEKTFDESSFARRVAHSLGTAHHELVVGAEDSLEIVPHIADILDEPMADASIIPTAILSRFTREKVTVALGGDGSDEIFAGYDTFVAEKYAKLFSLVPEGVVKGILVPMANRLPTSFSNISFDYKVKKFLSGFSGPELYRHIRWLGTFDSRGREELFLPNVAKSVDPNVFSDIDVLRSGFTGRTKEDWLTYLYLRTYLLDDILVKVDRASMRYSLEVRAPFLDTQLVDLVSSFPHSYKFSNGSGKHILKTLMRGRLPDDILNRPKKGFGIPIAEWLSGPLRPLVTDMLSRERISNQGIFDPVVVERLLSDHLGRKRDNRKELWTLLVFQLWFQKWK